MTFLLLSTFAREFMQDAVAMIWITMFRPWSR